MLVVDVEDVGTRSAAITAALAGGIDTVQLRDRRVAGGTLLVAARALRALADTYGATLVVNDRIDVACAARADGVHLPAASFPIAVARALLGDGALVGRSTHGPMEAGAAAREGADYVVLGPIFATPSKEAFGAPLGVAALAATRIAVPLVAIGGVTVERVAEIRRAGAAGVAIVRAVLDAPDPGAAARALVNALTAPL
jgi:thiamine-phosphate pyrophosphorylase